MGSVLEDRQKTQMTHQAKGAVEKISVDPEAIEVRGEGLDLQVKMGLQGLWDLLALGDFQEGTDCPPPWDLLPPLD